MTTRFAGTEFTLAEFCEAGLLSDQYLQPPYSGEDNQPHIAVNAGQMTPRESARSLLPEPPRPLRRGEPSSQRPAHSQSQGQPSLTEAASYTLRHRELNRKHQRQYRQREKVVATVGAPCRIRPQQQAVQKLQHNKILHCLLIPQERLQALKTQLAKTEEDLAKSQQQQQNLEKILMSVQISKKPAFLCVPTLHQQQNLVTLCISANQALHTG